jgi:hypothetical protein
MITKSNEQQSPYELLKPLLSVMDDAAHNYINVASELQSLLAGQVELGINSLATMLPMATFPYQPSSTANAMWQLLAQGEARAEHLAKVSRTMQGVFEGLYKLQYEAAKSSLDSTADIGHRLHKTESKVTQALFNRRLDDVLIDFENRRAASSTSEMKARSN